MKGATPKIYRVLPDANNLVVRKVRGLGLSLGITAQVVNDAKCLPSIPPDNAILMLPENVRIPKADNHDQTWSQIFIVSSDQSFRHGRYSSIIVDSKDEPGATETKILRGVLAVRGISSGLGWHASSIMGQSSFSEFIARFNVWSHEFKIFTCASVASLTTALAQLIPYVGASATTYEISLDGESIRLSLKIKTNNNLTQNIVRDVLTCPHAYLTIMKLEDPCITATIFSSLSSTLATRLRFTDLMKSDEQINQEGGDGDTGNSGADPAKEAS